MNLWLIMLYSFIVLAVLGLVLGVVLVVAGHFLHVKEDNRIADVEKMLPNLNCGACGNAGCHDMAEKVVKGEMTKLSVCKPGKKDLNFEPIIKYMEEHPDEDGTKHVPTI